MRILQQPETIFPKKNRKVLSKSFTLIELLVVIALIGLLASIVLVSLQDATAHARDSKRDAEAGETNSTLRKTLEVYHSVHGTYPHNEDTEGDVGCCIEDNDAIKLDLAPYITDIPEDPRYNPNDPKEDHDLSKYCYRYKTVNGGEDYKIRVNYERTGTKTIASWGGGDIDYDATGGPSGHALQFDGNDHIDCGGHLSLNLTNEMTVEAWIYVATIDGFGYSIMEKAVFEKDSRLQYSLYLLSASDARFTVHKGGSDFFASSDSYPLDTWTHIVGRYDGSEVSIWLNGVKQPITSTVAPPLDSGNDALLFGKSILFNLPFKGIADEIRIYNRALSPEEITEHHNGTFSNETGLVGLWHFNEGVGDTTADDSGNGSNGNFFPACPDCPGWITL
ncbi:prepilin-type N-terminal cleavage/methylation domain-containing protein [Candidatus Parcubacteria bacterium]|nr:prepilin-type N-terminal cleavage/methylation domain-containing protein [Candidatus Parcubacteria bacterium]